MCRAPLKYPWFKVGSVFRKETADEAEPVRGTADHRNCEGGAPSQGSGGGAVPEVACRGSKSETRPMWSEQRLEEVHAVFEEVTSIVE